MGRRSVYATIDSTNCMKWRSPKSRENARNIETAFGTHATTTTTTTSTTTTTTTTA